MHALLVRASTTARLLLAALALATVTNAAEDTQVTTTVVQASAEELWQAHLSPEGLKKLWGVAQADVDFRLGGAIRTHDDPAAQLGGPGTVVHTILAYEPGRMLALATRMPDGAPEALRRWCERGWHVTRIEPLGAKLARFTVTGCGYGDDADSKLAREFFERGNAAEFELMKRNFGGEPARQASEQAFARLAALVGHDYVAEDELGVGRVVRAHARWTRIVGGFLLCESWISDDGASLRAQSHALYGLDPALGTVGFWKFGEGGTLTRGTLLLDGERGVGHDWLLEAPGAEPRRLYVQIEPGAEGYLFRAQPSLEEKTTLVHFEYRRVADLPPGFEHASK